MSKSTPVQPLSMEAVVEIIKTTSSILHWRKLLDTTVSLIQQQTGVDYVALFLVNETGQGVTLQAQCGGEPLPTGYKLEPGGKSLVNECIATSQLHLLANPAPDTDPVLLATARSVLGLPLIVHKAVLGAIILQSHAVAAFAEPNLPIWQTIANQLAIAIENARVFSSMTSSQQVAEDLLHETIALQQLSQALSGTLKFDEILDVFFQTCTKMLGFDYVIFSMVDRAQQRVKAVGGIGVTETHLKRANHPLSSTDIMADIIRTGLAEIITGDDPRFNREIFEAEGMSEWGMRLFTPIKLRGENVGLVEVGFNKHVETPIQDAQIRLLRSFIDQTALAIDNAERYEESKRAIRREALLKEFITKVRATANVDIILQTAVREIGDAMGGKRVYIHLVSPQEETV